jgi:HlyD family secretion protein
MANPKSRRRRKRIIFAVIVLAVAGLTLAAVFKNKEAVVTIQKEKVARRNLVELVPASGKIQPVVQVKLSCEVSGEITELPVKEGQEVKKGDLLVKIKPDNYTASRNSAEASYKLSIANRESSEANLERSRLEFERVAKLHQNKLISDSEHQQAKTTFDMAVAQLAASAQQVSMAQAQLARADDDLSKTTIYSPITGTVTKLSSQLGERVVGTATMAGTEIMTVSDLNEMETRVDIGEVDVVLIKVGQIARLDVDAFKDHKFKGSVTEIANSSKTTAASTSQDATKFEVKIRFLEKDAFRPGMSVTADIETRYRSNVLTVPIQCITTRMPKDTSTNSAGSTNVAAKKEPAEKSPDSSRSGDKKKAGEPPKAQEVVFVLEGDHAKMVPVKKGIADDDYYEIVEGLKEGDEVVTGSARAIRDLEDGKKVAVGTDRGVAIVEKRN